MGDSVSLPTNVSQVDTISRIQQSQQTDKQAEEKFSKALREQSDDDQALTKNISETQRSRLERRRRDEESRKRREEQRRESKESPEGDAEGRGQRIDVKV